MMTLTSLDELLDFALYRVFLRERLKRLSEQREPVFVSKARLDFRVNGSAWKAHAIVFGKKSRPMAQTLRKEGAPFLEGVGFAEGRRLVLEGFPDKHVAGARRTVERLKLGCEVVGGGAVERAPAANERDDLDRRAARIEQAVRFWQRAELGATAELRKLQRAIAALNLPAGKAVIRGLETIRSGLERLDDEAAEAAEAARRGDARAFVSARADFLAKVDRIRDHVERNELIRAADSNPEVPLGIRSLLTLALARLRKAV